MNRFRNILLVIDPNKFEANNAALRSAINLAKINDGKLMLMWTIERPSSITKQFRGIFNQDELLAYFIREAESQLLEIAKIAIAEGIEVQAKVVAGKNFIEIVRQMLLGKHDLLIKLADLQTSSFTSGDFHLMRKCPKPVWLIKNDQAEVKKVVAAIDLSLETEEEGRELNSLIMDLAIGLSKMEESELSVLSCWRLYGEYELRHSSFLHIPDEEVEALVAEEKRANENAIDNLLARHNADFAGKVLLKGRPGEVIPEYVNSEKANVVVMGTIARSGIPGLLIGNTAETVLQSINSSVITVKPKGFGSPIGD